MTSDEHCSQLGKLLGNFHSLEFILKVYLQKHSLPKPIETTAFGTDFYSFPVGTELAENEITNYNTLGQLISKFNTLIKQKGLPEIDNSIVDIRDALAHGRVSASTNYEMRLIKFSKPKNGKVKVIFNADMTEEWFKSNKKIVFDAIEMVHKLL